MGLGYPYAIRRLLLFLRDNIFPLCYTSKNLLLFLEYITLLIFKYLDGDTFGVVEKVTIVRAVEMIGKEMSAGVRPFYNFCCFFHLPGGKSVEKVKALLGFRARGRKIMEGAEGYQVKEEPEAYIPFQGRKRGHRL